MASALGKQLRSRTGALLTSLLLGLGAVAATAPSASATTEAARPADALVDSIGVATHFSYTPTVYYQRFDQIKEKLAQLGVRHIREDLLPNRNDQYQRLNQLAAMGIGSTLIMGSPTNGISGLETLLAVARTKLQGVDALEGPNEYYLSGKSNWASLTREYQQRLYEGAKSSPATASIPILGPSTIFWQAGELGDVSQWADYGTIHPYPGAYPSEDYLGRHMEFAARSTGSKPLMATETGYHTALNYGGGAQPVTEAVAGAYIPRMLLDSYSRGIRRTFLYQLVDTFSNPANDDPEDHYGLLRNDLSETPAFTATKNLISILRDPGPAFAPGSLDLTVGGNRTGLRQVLMQKRDGTFYLALWRNSRLWEPNAKATLSAAAATVTVTVPNLTGASVYMPNRSASPVESRRATGAQFSLNVGPEVVIVELGHTSSGSPAIGPAEAVETAGAPAPVESTPSAEAPIVPSPAPTVPPQPAATGAANPAASYAQPKRKSRGRGGSQVDKHRGPTAGKRQPHRGRRARA